MPTALVTGITGQDGSYLADDLTARGWDLHGVNLHQDEALARQLERTPQVQFHRGDLADPSQVARIVDEVEPDYVFNLGGISSVAYSWEQPTLTGQVSGLGAVALLEACWQTQQRVGRQVRFLQASSAEIFGAARTSPQTELTPVAPVTPYGAAKAYAHQMVGIYRSRGMHASTVILFNHESPRRPAQFVTRKITQGAARIASGRQDRLSLGNLDARRDWGWAPDYVNAMTLAIEHDEPSDYVIATGVARSVADFVTAAFEAAGIPDWQDRVDIDSRFSRANDVVEQVGDPARARDVLGWAPTVTFEQMVARMVEVDLADPTSSDEVNQA